MDTCDPSSHATLYKTHTFGPLGVIQALWTALSPPRAKQCPPERDPCDRGKWREQDDVSPSILGSQHGRQSAHHRCLIEDGELASEWSMGDTAIDDDANTRGDDKDS